MYRRQPSLLTPAEAKFHHVLKQAIGSDFELYAKVRIADVLATEVEPGQGWYRAFNSISRKHFDFVLASPGSARPVLAVELDDSSHGAPSRQRRDALVDEACAAAGLPILHHRVRSSYDAVALRRAVDRCIAEAPRQPPAREHAKAGGIANFLLTLAKIGLFGRQASLGARLLPWVLSSTAGQPASTSVGRAVVGLLLVSAMAGVALFVSLVHGWQSAADSVPRFTAPPPLTQPALRSLGSAVSQEVQTPPAAQVSSESAKDAMPQQQTQSSESSLGKKATVGLIHLMAAPVELAVSRTRSREHASAAPAVTPAPPKEVAKPTRPLESQSQPVIEAARAEDFLPEDCLVWTSQAHMVDCKNREMRARRAATPERRVDDGAGNFVEFGR